MSSTLKPRLAKPVFVTWVSVVAVIGIIVQVFHSFEHIAQFFVWLAGGYQFVSEAFCGRDTPYMTSMVARSVAGAGAFFFPTASVARQMTMGAEILEVVMNVSFTASIFCLYGMMRTKWVRFALCFESIHLCEHLMLAVTAFVTGEPLGVSTMAGYAREWWGQEYAVGYRVSLHFLLNLTPLALLLVAYANRRRG